MGRVTEADVLPYLGRNSYIEDGFVMTPAGTAWTLSDYLNQRRYRLSEKRKAYDAERHRIWVEANREHIRAYSREWHRRKRAALKAAA